jgi:hypothetical protein
MTWLRPRTTSDWITLPPYIYIISVYSPFNAVNGHMDETLLHQSHGGGLSWLNLAHNWVQNIPLQLRHSFGQEPLQTGLHFHLIYILTA